MTRVFPRLSLLLVDALVVVVGSSHFPLPLAFGVAMLEFLY